jgi:hypothetical protein
MKSIKEIGLTNCAQPDNCFICVAIILGDHGTGNCNYKIKGPGDECVNPFEPKLVYIILRI